MNNSSELSKEPTRSKEICHLSKLATKSRETTKSSQFKEEGRRKETKEYVGFEKSRNICFNEKNSYFAERYQSLLQGSGKGNQIRDNKPELRKSK